MTRRISPESREAIREGARKGGSAHAGGGKGDRWMLALPLTRRERQRVLRAAEAAGLPAGQWVARLVRGAITPDVVD